MTTAIVKPEAMATFTVTTPVVVEEHPSEVVYSEGFEGGTLNGWSTGTVDAFGLETGSYGLRLVSGTGVTTIATSFTATGLVIGRAYTFAVRARTFQGSPSIQLTGGPTSNVAAATTSVFATFSVTFTASATSHVLTITETDPAATASQLAIDNVTLTKNAWTETTLTPELPISAGKVTLDDGWMPYVQATFDVPLASLDLVEQIDPMDDQRVSVLANEAWGGSVRTFDLSLRGRRIDHKEKKITVELASDEALLIDKKRLASTVDTTPRTHEASLRAIVDWALGKIGASLEAGTDDADMTAAWPVTNLLKNPTAASSVTDWTSGSGSTTIAHNSGAGVTGTGFCRGTQTAATGAIFLCSTTYDLAATPGKRYVLSAYSKHSVAGASATITLRWLDANNATIRNDVSASQSLGTAWGTRWTVSGVAPANAVRVAPYMSISGSASTRTWDIDHAMLYEDDRNEPVGYFDGAATVSGYTLAWQGTANASASTRTPTVERPRELFDWKPGVSLWDFLQPLLEAAGLRLFCDEARDWRVVDLGSYEVAGNIVVLEKVNALRGEDEVTRNDASWATGVVCVYRWTDALGIAREAYDFAGTDSKVVTFEYEREYPGPGAAASLLGRLAGKGRTQEVTRLVDYTTTPGMDATINLPGTLPQVGKVRQVIFDLKGGVMDLGTRGLTEVTPGSWLGADPALEWDDTPTTDIDWEDWT